MVAWFVQMWTCLLQQNKAHMNNSQAQFLQLAPCSLHPVDSACKYGLQEFDFPFDIFFHDLSFFFHLSIARREDLLTEGERISEKSL